jgi:hypothetical protein
MVCENSPKMMPNPFLLKLLDKFCCGKSSSKNWPTVALKKTVQSKHSPKRRNFVQFGHPAYVHAQHIIDTKEAEDRNF